MRLAIGLSVIAAGLILLMMGVNASNSIASDISRFFTGNPTDRAVWCLLSGSAAVVFGMFLAITTPGILKRR